MGTIKNATFSKKYSELRIAICDILTEIFDKYRNKPKYGIH